MGKLCTQVRPVAYLLKFGGKLPLQGLTDLAQDRYTFASQLAVLRSCPEVLSRLLRKDDSVLLAAKVLVISRLLHKKLSEQNNTVTYIDMIRQRLSKLRQKLLTRIDRRLKYLGHDTQGLVDAMCAFALATSSSTMDILRHFHYLRLKTISAQDQTEQSSDHDILGALRLWVQTIQDTHGIFPRQLATSLARLKSIPLLQDQGVLSIPELDYEVHEPWVGDDIKNFIPYVRHDDLSVSTATEYLSRWAPEAIRSLVQRLRRMLRSTASTSAIVDLRRNFFELWLSSQAHLKGIHELHALGSFRGAFNDRLNALIRENAGTLVKVTTTITDLVQQSGFDKHVLSPSLWTVSPTSLQLNDGADTFTKELRAAYRGECGIICSVLQLFHGWVSKMRDLEMVIEEMERVDWNHTLDEAEDNNLEDDVPELLSKVDPGTLRVSLRQAVRYACLDMQCSVNDLTNDLGHYSKSSPRVIFLLRALREIRLRLPANFEVDGVLASSVRTLHEIVGCQIVDRVMADHKTRICRSVTRRRIPGRPLWDGNPELPVLPSSWTVAFLQALQSALDDVGQDIWSPQAMDQIKRTVRVSLAKQLLACRYDDQDINGHGASDNFGQSSENSMALHPVAELSGDREDNDHEQRTHLLPASDDRKVQHLFDLVYVSSATYIDPKHHFDRVLDPLSECYQQMRKETAIEFTDLTRLEANANGYWKRTSLLFGLLIS